MYLVDKGVLLDNPKVIQDFNHIYVMTKTCLELEELREEPGDKGKRTTKVLNSLYHNPENVTILDSTSLPPYVDFLITAAREGLTIVTKSVPLLLLAQQRGISAEFYQKKKEVYSGFYYLDANQEEDAKVIADFYEVKSSEKLNQMRENEYLVIKDGEESYLYRHKGNSFSQVRPGVGNSIPETDLNDKIVARNIEQLALINSLMDDNMKIVSCGGAFGTGKTKLLTSFALYALDKGFIDKIVIITNNSQVNNSRELGVLPGSLLEKENVYLGGIVDVVGSLIEVERLYNQEQIEILPLAVARGRNLANSIILVSEAQNLTENHVKLLLGRCAEGSRIFFDGDIKQSDKQIFREESGLQLLDKLSESEEFAKIFSKITLKSVERSDTARASQYLDEIE